MGRVYGSSMQGLIDFLFELGVRVAHIDPHVVAAYDPVVGDRAGTAVARKMVAMDLDNPRVMLVPEVTEKFVIHVTVTAAPEDGVLAEDTWRAIAESIAEHLGFDEVTPPGTPVRWIGVHHGVTRNGHDHVHLVAHRVAEDGRMHRFPRPPGVMLNEVRQNMEIVHGLRRVGHRPRLRQAS